MLHILCSLHLIPTEVIMSSEICKLGELSRAYDAASAREPTSLYMPLSDCIILSIAKLRRGGIA
jgi:hypothetical protein